mmetsp:Transcript_57404/g.179830  ORF Transcript_57404/g.179830 Transcript_57404/m.179830 type:complete len:270 (-) Transcript_57404:740-1549(-)
MPAAVWSIRMSGNNSSAGGLGGLDLASAASASPFLWLTPCLCAEAAPAATTRSTGWSEDKPSDSSLAASTISSVRQTSARACGATRCWRLSKILLWSSRASLLLVASGSSVITRSRSLEAVSNSPSSKLAIARLYLALVLVSLRPREAEQSSSASLHLLSLMWAKARFECSMDRRPSETSVTRLDSTSQMALENHRSDSSYAPCEKRAFALFFACSMPFVLNSTTMSGIISASSPLGAAAVLPTALAGVPSGASLTASSAGAGFMSVTA